MSKITYDDKVDLHVDSNIADINKVSASDMNEIKSAVNDNDDSLGDISTLTTTDKTSVVNAVNELENDKLETSAVVNEPSTETDEVYSSGYLNDKLVSVGSTTPTDGRRVWFKKSKNLWGGLPSDVSATHNTVAFINYANGSISMNGTATGGTAYSILSTGIISNHHYITLPAGTYTASKSAGNFGVEVLSVNVSGSSTSILTTIQAGETSQTFTLNAETNICLRVRIASGVNITNTTANIQLEEGSTATTYETFKEPSINVDNETIYQRPVVLWTNASPTSDFATQTITLSDDITTYSYYEVLYYLSTNNTETFNSGKIPISKDTRISVPRHYIGYRTVQPKTALTMMFSNHSQFTTYGSSTVTNTNSICIPYQVLGYK